MQAYCIKCHKRTEIKDPHEVRFKNGSSAIHGVCPKCGTKLLSLNPRSQPDLMPLFLEACPEFVPSWQKHLEWWNGEDAGAYNNISVLARFIIESYESEDLEPIKRIFALTESLLEKEELQITEILTIGLIEDIQNISLGRPYGCDVFLKFLGPRSTHAWNKVIEMWKGKSSLMDMIRAEKREDAT